ncbi:hypothetical protein BGZ51_003420 [Haplosporangium sp. Z 767]|nr:hypothetical protein BGZ50_009705 [Haplosporangium sp. Z 11]KAF9193369.1 hypothetical protein BGZ51_003420 [Haplosporangium sp. Z 767]
MSTGLSKRRKHELKELAASLGLSVEGLNKDLIDRIKNHVAKHGSDDPELRQLLREESPRTRRSTESARLASLSSTNEDGDSSEEELTQHRTTRSSPKRKSTATATTTRISKKTESDSESAEDPLSEHQVHNFMDHMQTDLHGAKEKAQALEHIIQEKYQSGKEALRRASKDFSYTVTHAVDDVVGTMNNIKEKSKGLRRESHNAHDDDNEDRQHHRRHHRRRHSHTRYHGNDEDGEPGWGVRIFEELRHRVANCTGACDFSTCSTRCWQYVQDLGSTSLGFVWITFVLELAVFMSAAHFQYGNDDNEGWLSCWHFFTNWDAFLKPFFAYYGTLFVIPTLLSQLFNVDRARKLRHHEEDEHHHHRPHLTTGLLSRKTTSGLSYFVFKFALTYVLSQTETPVHTATGLAGLAKETVENLAGVHGHHHHHYHHLWSGYKLLTEVFRYVPPSLGMATSGVGTVLALAESIVSRRR